jgi:TPR repeat protein
MSWVRWLWRAADAGYSKAMSALGLVLSGRGELGEAESWYRRAADAGDSNAMVLLRVLLQKQGELDEARGGCGGRPTPAIPR